MLKNLFLAGILLFGFNSFADDAATTAATEVTEVATALCLTDAAVAELVEAGYACAAALDEEGVAIEGTMICTLEGADDVLLDVAVCPVTDDGDAAAAETATAAAE